MATSILISFEGNWYSPMERGLGVCLEQSSDVLVSKQQISELEISVARL